MAKLTPLGWTFTGPVGGLEGGDFQSNLADTYFVGGESDTNEISRLLRQFWEIENPSTAREHHILNPDDRCALEQVDKSLKHVDG